MARTRDWLLGGAAVALGLAALGAGTYNTDRGLRLRAALGQDEARLALALRRYRAGDATAAFALFEPLMLADYAPAVAVVCDILGTPSLDDPRGAARQDGCDTDAKVTPMTRLEQLSDVAFMAREWGALEQVLARRLAAGDTRAHFDMARYEALSRPEALQVEAVVAHLRRAADHGDPRGQYLMAVYQLHDATKDPAAQAPLSQTFAKLIAQSPPVTAGDAYFELAKLMQAGLIGSELAYSDVLLRADELGNRFAAGYLAQYLLSNPDKGEIGGADAAAWVEKAAAHGDPVAQYNHALALLDAAPADAVPRTDANTDAAEKLLLASAATGFAPSHTRLGALYWQQPQRAGGDVEAGRQRALEHWQIAADKGDANALYNLAQVALAQGRREAGIKYLEASAAQGHKAAGDALKAAR